MTDPTEDLLRRQRELGRDWFGGSGSAPAALHTAGAVDGPKAPEPVYKAVERILDEHSAWIARPNVEVTKRVALAATLAAQRIIEESAQQDQRDLSEIEARVRPTICPTWSSDGGDQGWQGRISSTDFDALLALAKAEHAHD